MLKGMDPAMTPELMDVLMRMGHGDELILVDRNYPALATAAHCVMPDPVRLPGLDAPQAARLITDLLPLDTFTDYGALRMEVDNRPDDIAPVHEEVFAVLRASAPQGVTLASIERQAFYAQARNGFAVVACAEHRPFGCFILRAGVVFED